MSRYHTHCTEPDPKKPTPTRLLTTKPFCDCKRCVCENCPDILDLLSITVTDSSCYFGSKMKSKLKIPEPSESSESTGPDMLEVINQDRDCSCDVVAHGVREHVHMNLGMTERRSKITNFTEPCEEQCTAHLPEDAKPPTPSNPKAPPAKPVTDNDSKMKTAPHTKCKFCDSVPRKP